MDDVLIRAEGLGKKYVIGHQAQRERYTALRDVIARGARTFLRKASDLAHGRAVIEGDELEEVWALKDVSFEVKRGEVLGIIGRNGAGKSTLLKILSRITEPSAGRVTLKGRVASLLEVGTGFHPELSGRENIFLNGAILGMTRAEIRKRFDEIVAFAEIERFLDTPVKRYSSGMYVRLAFAVAAHLEPEILVVDEVLAVGDAEFQKRCLGKLEEVSARRGRTVLFVSHNLTAVQALCGRAVLLRGGRVERKGSPHEVIARYLGTDPRLAPAEGGLRGEHIWHVAATLGEEAERALTVVVEIAGVSDYRPRALDLCVTVSDHLGRAVLGLVTIPGDLEPILQSGGGSVQLGAAGVVLRPGHYHVDVELAAAGQRVESVAAAAILAVAGVETRPWAWTEGRAGPLWLSVSSKVRPETRPPRMG